MKNVVVGLVSRVQVRIRTKLLTAFLAMVLLLVVLGAVGLRALSGANQQTEELIKLQRQIAAYRQVQHDTTNPLYSVATALLFSDDQMLEGALRQLNQLSYDIIRLEFVTPNEAELVGQ